LQANGPLMENDARRSLEEESGLQRDQYRRT
jgi:hypothetical protein